jgi:hypothetical protein
METSHQPFRRVMAFVAAVNALVAGGMSRAVAIATQGTYRSRGKGLGKHSGKSVGRNFPTSFKCNSGSDMDHNGARECARRLRQMENGQLHFATFNHKPAILDMKEAA